MTIGAWVFFIAFAIPVFIIGVGLSRSSCNVTFKVIWIVVAIAVCGLIFGACHWYCKNTASGVRAMTDQKAELSNGLDRTINVYTANGDLIATYEGKIDLEDNEGGYILFDYNGKRYTYYNCFVESIADIY